MRVPRSFTNLRIQTADETCPRCSRRMLEKTTSNVHGIMDVCFNRFFDNHRYKDSLKEQKHKKIIRIKFDSQ